jgi:hypothetical protein
MKNQLKQLLQTIKNSGLFKGLTDLDICLNVIYIYKNSRKNVGYINLISLIDQSPVYYDILVDFLFENLYDYFSNNSRINYQIKNIENDFNVAYDDILNEQMAYLLVKLFEEDYILKLINLSWQDLLRYSEKLIQNNLKNQRKKIKKEIENQKKYYKDILEKYYKNFVFVDINSSIENDQIREIIAKYEEKILKISPKNKKKKVKHKILLNLEIIAIKKNIDPDLLHNQYRKFLKQNSYKYPTRKNLEEFLKSIKII